MREAARLFLPSANLSSSSDEAERLVRIQVDGTTFEVPGGENVLSSIQYIVKDSVPVLGRFCWSDECGNCEVTVVRKGSSEEETIRGCQTEVEDGMSLSNLKPDLRYWLAHKLR